MGDIMTSNERMCPYICAGSLTRKGLFQRICDKACLRHAGSADMNANFAMSQGAR